MSSHGKLTFVDAVALGFRRWRDVRGTSPRGEFWYWVLFTTLVNMVLSTFDAFVFPSQLSVFMTEHPVPVAADLPAMWSAARHDAVWSLQSFASVILFIPSSTMVVRRFRDAGLASSLGWAVVILPLACLGGLIAITQVFVSLDPNVSTTDPTLLGMTFGLLVIVATSVACAVIYLVGTLRSTRRAPLDGPRP